ncbi:MAG: hypothetical protein FJ266_14530 [Planctomycetes bacterium]|nr:hypothetical protein [Planctomycetota bacterium]
MDFIDETFPVQQPEFVLCTKKVLYTFFVFIYDLLYELDKPISLDSKAKSISLETIAKIKLANERLYNRTAPQKYLEATDRRTTNPKERKLLFEYLTNSLQ